MKIKLLTVLKAPNLLDLIISCCSYNELAILLTFHLANCDYFPSYICCINNPKLVLNEQEYFYDCSFQQNYSYIHFLIQLEQIKLIQDFSLYIKLVHWVFQLYFDLFLEGCFHGTTFYLYPQFEIIKTFFGIQTNFGPHQL